MAGTTSSIISNLLSSLKRISQFMPNFSSLAASSSSSIAQEDVTTAKVDSIQKTLMEDLSRLSRMLQRIQAVLHDAEEREIYDKAIQLWLNELREVAYDAEDVLDQYDYQVIKIQVEGMTAAAEAEPSLNRKLVDDHDDDMHDYQNYWYRPADVEEFIENSNFEPSEEDFNKSVCDKIYRRRPAVVELYKNPNNESWHEDFVNNDSDKESDGSSSDEDSDSNSCDETWYLRDEIIKIVGAHSACHPSNNKPFQNI